MHRLFSADFCLHRPPRGHGRGHAAPPRPGGRPAAARGVRAAQRRLAAQGYYSIIYCNILYYTILCYAMLYYTILY